MWIISDARRKTDIKYFRDAYQSAAVTVRITADIQTRAERYTHIPGVRSRLA